MAIDWTKPIETRDGRKARYIGELNHPTWRRIVASVDAQSGHEHLSSHTDEGLYASEGISSADIRNVPEPVKFMDMAMRFVVVDTRNGRIECTMDTEEGAKSFVGPWGPTFVVARLPAKLEVV